MSAENTPAPRRASWHLWAMAKVGVIGFGGGSALIPVMEKELVRPGRMSEGQFVQDTVISNLTPGALPVKLAALSGARVSGARMAAAGALAVALPGTAGTLLLLWLFAALGEEAVRVMEFASLGVSAFILYLLAHYMSKVLVPRGRPHLIGIIVAVVAFVLTGSGKVTALVEEFTGFTSPWVPGELSALGLILFALAFISLGTFVQAVTRGIRHRRGNQATERHPGIDGNSAPALPPRGRIPRAAALAALLLGSTAALTALLFPGPSVELFGLIALSTVSSFGGGEAYVGVADGYFVSSGIVTPEVFFGQIVPIANALPGPILVKIAAGIAYIQGQELGGPAVGFLFATLVLMLTVTLCAVVALLLLSGYSRAGRSLLVRNIGAYILPVICGLLASTALSLLQAGVSIVDQVSISGIAACGVMLGMALLAPPLRNKFRLPDLIIIAVYAGVTLALVSLF